jgi:hypothetical protein
MIQQIGQSEDNVLGYRVIGDVTKEDYANLEPAVKAAVAEYGAVRLLFDLSEFKWEKIDAWGTDLGFGNEFKDTIERMALVGTASWGKYLTKMAKPFYAQQAEWFEDVDKAWTWVKS